MKLFRKIRRLFKAKKSEKVEKAGGKRSGTNHFVVRYSSINAFLNFDVGDIYGSFVASLSTPDQHAAPLASLAVTFYWFKLYFINFDDGASCVLLK